MKRTLTLLVLVLILMGSLMEEAYAQRNKYRQRLEEARVENWPPPKVYSRLSLGYALQGVFKKHFEFCGFSTGDKRRDYLPADISRFLGRRDLRTKVEMADMKGGGLLYYIFSDDEVRTGLDHIRYNNERVLQLQGVQNQFEVNPDVNFDAFLLTKNCSGYLKASLDAGIEPPYAAFKTALNTDDRRESTVLAVSGAFSSPLRPLLRSNDQRTNELMFRLWQFYQEQPNYINRAYFLSGFEGVMIRHMSQAEQTDRVLGQVGVNVNIPLLANFRTDFSQERTSSAVFSGTDWETIVYADFDYNYPREQMFSALPGPSDIGAHFANLRPSFQKQKDFPLLTEGAEHRHYLTLPGVPQAMCNNFWMIEAVASGIYAELPRLHTQYYQGEDGSFGCRFTISGRPDPNLFQGQLTDRPSKVALSYRIRSREPIAGQYIYLNINEELQTSTHPSVRMLAGRFDLSTREDRRFAFQWRVPLEIEDQDNPVDFAVEPYIANLQLRRENQRLEVDVVGIEADAHNKTYYLVLETRNTWPLHRINDRNMQTYNLDLEVHLPKQRSQIRSIRPLKGIVNFPSILAEDPLPLPIRTVPLTPVESGGGTKGG